MDTVWEIIKGILVIGGLTAAIWRSIKYDAVSRLRNTKNCEQMTLFVPYEVFQQRFSQDIASPPHKAAFQGDTFRDKNFYFCSWKGLYGPRIYTMTITGMVEGVTVYYRISGADSHPEIERERLINKLRELCAPEA